MVKGALSGERLGVVGAPGRKSSVVCFVGVTSHSTFCAEPGRSGATSLKKADKNGENRDDEQECVNGFPGSEKR